VDARSVVVIAILVSVLSLGMAAILFGEWRNYRADREAGLL
jgi:hypothetical protein